MIRNREDKGLYDRNGLTYEDNIIPKYNILAANMDDGKMDRLHVDESVIEENNEPGTIGWLVAELNHTKVQVVYFFTDANIKYAIKENYKESSLTTLLEKVVNDYEKYDVFLTFYTIYRMFSIRRGE